MSNETIHVTNGAEVKKRLELLAGKADLAARKIVIAGSVLIKDEAQSIFKPTPVGSRMVAKNGHVYYSLKPPYEPTPPIPTSRTGHLRRSIGRKQLVHMSPGQWMSVTGPSMKYGRRVELGGPRAFPYMKPGLEKARPQLVALYNKVWREAIA